MFQLADNTFSLTYQTGLVVLDRSVTYRCACIISLVRVSVKHTSVKQRCWTTCKPKPRLQTNPNLNNRNLCDDVMSNSFVQRSHHWFVHVKILSSVWPSLLKGVVGGLVWNFAMDIFQSHPNHFSHPKISMARGGGWLNPTGVGENSPAGKHFPKHHRMLKQWNAARMDFASTNTFWRYGDVYVTRCASGRCSMLQTLVLV